MTSLNPAALDAAQERGEYLLVDELVIDVERYDDAADPGVSRERLAAYADELSERTGDLFDGEQLQGLIDDELTDAETWAGHGSLYEVAGGISAFPPEWHDRLDGEDDVVEFVRVMEADLAASDAEEASGGEGEGVPQTLLIDALSALGPYSVDGAHEELEAHRTAGALEELADQHPNARVRVAGGVDRD